MHFQDAEHDPLRVGIPLVDIEHAELMAAITRLMGPPSVHINSEEFSEIISRLGQQLATHFSHEEEIILSCGLPAHDAAAHIKAHVEILEQYTRLQLDLMFRPAPDQEEIVDMIRSWIVVHLTAFDLKLRPYASRFSG